MGNLSCCDTLEISHPQLSNLYNYWLNQCQDGALPARARFDVVDLAPWLGHLMIIQPQKNGEDFLYKLHGTALVNIVGEDLTGSYLSNFTEENRRNHITKQYRRVCESGCPEFKDSSKPFEKNYKTIQKLILPVANDGQNVDCLIVGVYGEINWETRGTSDLTNSFSTVLQG